MQEKEQEFSDNEFEERAYQLTKKWIQEDKPLFRERLTFYKNFYGLVVKSARGLELFKEVCRPELERINKFLSNPEKRAELISSLTSYNNALWFRNYNELVISIAEVSKIGIKKDSLNTNIDPFTVSDTLLDRLFVFRQLLTDKKYARARFFFGDADQEHVFSAIELLAIKTFHIGGARKIYFSLETDPDFSKEDLKSEVGQLIRELEKFLMLAKKYKTARFFKRKKRDDLVSYLLKSTMRYPITGDRI